MVVGGGPKERAEEFLELPVSLTELYITAWMVEGKRNGDAFQLRSALIGALRHSRERFFSGLSVTASEDDQGGRNEEKQTLNLWQKQKLTYNFIT